MLTVLGEGYHRSLIDHDPPDGTAFKIVYRTRRQPPMPGLERGIPPNHDDALLSKPPDLVNSINMIMMKPRCSVHSTDTLRLE